MKSQYRMLFAITVLLIAVGCLCNGTSIVPTPTDASVPTDLPGPNGEATEPPTASAEQPSPAQDFFTEEFDGDISNWTYFTTKNDTKADDSGVQPVAENGFLVMDISKNLNVYAIYEANVYENVRLDVRVDNRGTNNNNINLVCRYSDEGWYEIAIANNGLYWLYAYNGAKGSYTRLADGGSNKIKAGKEVNEYTFICNDRNLILEINGFETNSYTDNQYVFRDGQVGVGLSSFKDIPVKVEFDWVKISEP
jgi:hypothetical protein